MQGVEEEPEEVHAPEGEFPKGVDSVFSALNRDYAL